MTDSESTEIMDEVCGTHLCAATQRLGGFHVLCVCGSNVQAEALRFASETSWDVWVKNDEVRRLLTLIRTTTVKATNDESLCCSALCEMCSSPTFLKH